MFKRITLIIAYLALLGLNVFLFLTLREKSRNLALAQTLTSDAEVFLFVSDQKRQTEWLAVETQREELAAAASLLFDKIDTLRSQLLMPGSQIPVDYFTKPVAIDKKIQTDLWDAYRKLDETTTVFLETDLPSAHGQMVEFRDRALKQFKDIKARARVSAPGKHALPFYFNIGPGNEFRNDIGWTKKGDSVKWDNGNLLYINYMTRLESKINSPRALQSKRLLNKMSEIFATPGKLVIYGEIYDLSAITPAELVAICKYLGLFHTEVVESISSSSRDLSFGR